MSLDLRDYIKKFISGKIVANEFSDNYMCKWKQERDSNLLGKDEDMLSELLSSTFCVAICITLMKTVTNINLTMFSY